MKNDNRAEEVKRAIQAALGGGLSASNSEEDAVEAVLRALDKQKVFSYHKDDVLSLLSTAGRVLVVLSEDQNLTQRAISVYLDLSETMIDKTVKTLIAAGLITKTKVNRQNIYKVNEEQVLKHPDIRKLFEAISAIGHPGNKEVVAQKEKEDEPF
jgi:DNA-binding MarR family transcriptional regulator